MTSIVYQYTDATPFNGVVENKAIWATDYRYLNDAQELVYTWRAFVERLERLANESGEYLDAYRAQLEALSRMNAARPDEVRRRHVCGMFHRTSRRIKPVD